MSFWSRNTFDSQAIRHGYHDANAGATQNKLHGESPHMGVPGHSKTFYDPTDAYANLQAAVISIHPTIAPEKTVYFKAFITAFNESYSSNWDSESVFGRTDPIYMFKQTTRSITLSFKVPSVNSGDAYENLGRIQSLIHCLYPAYTNVGNATTIAQSPLCRLGVLNLTPAMTKGGSMHAVKHYGDSMRSQGLDAQGVLCAIKSLNLAHNIENAEGGVYQDAHGSFLPKFIEVSMDVDVIHERTLGWERQDEGMRFSNRRGPYGIATEKTRNFGQNVRPPGYRSTEDAERTSNEYRSRSQRFSSSLYNPAPPPSTENTLDPLLEAADSDASRAAAAEAQNDALRANAQARYGGLFGGLIARRDENSLGSDRSDALKTRAARLEVESEMHADTRRGNRLGYRAENALRAADDEMQRLEYIESMQDFIE